MNKENEQQFNCPHCNKKFYLMDRDIDMGEHCHTTNELIKPNQLKNWYKKYQKKRHSYSGFTMTIK